MINNIYIYIYTHTEVLLLTIILFIPVYISHNVTLQTDFKSAVRSTVDTM